MPLRSLLTSFVRLLLLAVAFAFLQANTSQAAVTYRSCNTGSGSAFWPYTVSFTKPAGTVAGDLIVINANVSAFYDAGGPPAGFTELHADGTPASFTWYKIAGASEPGSYTTEFMPATSTTAGVISTWTGTHPTAPIDLSARGAGSGTTATLAGTGMTVPRNGSMRVSATAVSANTTASYSGGMSKVSCERTSSPSVSVGYEAVNAGTLAARTATVGNGNWSSHMMVLRPAPTAPAVATISPGAGPTTGGTSVVITGTDFTGATGVTFGGVPGTGLTVNNDGQITVTAPAGAAGVADIRVTTPLGTSPNTSADDFTYYTPPTITSISPSVGPNAGGTSVTITGTNFAGLSGASAVVFGGTNATSYVVNNSTTITATAPAGTGTQNIRVTTPGGTTPNTAADDYTYYALPTVTALAPSSGPGAGGTSVTITGTNFAGLSGASAVQFGGTNATSYVVNSATSITATAPAGTGTQDVRVTTPGGTSANTAADNYTYYAIPTVTNLAPSSGPAAGGTSVTITGTNFTGLSGASAVQFGGTNAASYVVNNATTITATAPAGSGTQDVRVTTPGGTTANTGADDYTYIPLPTITSLSPTGGPTAGATTVTITGTGFTGATVVTFGGTNATGYTVDSSTQITATAPARAAGTVNVAVTTPGGTNANTAADDYTYYAVPTVSGIAPTSGPEAGGNSVVITGTNFSGLSGASAVQFGGTNATSYVVNSATQITATAPAGTGAVSVRVTTPGGTTANTAADDYTYVPLPTVTNVSPSAGPTTGGTTVTITGTNFTGASSVTFGGTNATGYTVDSATQITATAPARAAGNADVRVTTAGGTSANTAADDYAYFAAPTVTSISPMSGPAPGGTSVTITGTNLTGATAVTFGGVNATGYSVVNATTITATAPPGTGTVDVRVTTPGGTSANTAADDFTYIPAPTVVSLSPTQGPAAGGTTVTITGTTLTGATAVSFGGTAATGFTVVNGTTITATAPAHAAGSADVRVTTPSGTSPHTAADDYPYVAAPPVTGVSPGNGATAGGTAVTITGTGFTGTTQVTFGGTNATGYSVVNATTITATAPAHAAGTVDVRVTTVGGTSANTGADDYLYVDPPVVSSLTPSTGPATGGTVVTITGSFLTGATGVTFGGTPATSFLVVNATTITATAPAGSGVADVRVTTPSGTSANTAADNFTYVAAPTVTSLSPTQGPDVGGTSVVITGTNLTGATTVTFGGISAIGYTVDSATQITATAPAHIPATVDVRVTTVGGVSANTAADDFEYLNACGLGSLAISATDFSFTPVTMDGLDRTESTTTTMQVSDMTGAGLGWKVEIGTTQFSAGPGKTLDPGAAWITSANATPLGGSCSSPTSSVNTYPVPLPISPSSVKVYDAGIGTGLGPVDLELGVDLDIPGNAKEGTYQSTWTIDLSAAP